VGAKVGFEVVFGFLDFDALAYFKPFQGARTEKPDLSIFPATTCRPNPHYARDAVARSWRWPCHRATTGART
jgi:hypothetical protein